MNPPSLPFDRALRSSHDVLINFTPSAALNVPHITHSRAHVFILSDLFLVAEWMDAGDKAAKAAAVAREAPERVGMGGPMPEMWLCYPPLAGKHLAVAEGQQGESLRLPLEVDNAHLQVTSWRSRYYEKKRFTFTPSQT